VLTSVVVSRAHRVDLVQQYPLYEHWFARSQLLFFMLGMGATLSVGDFAQIFRRPRSLIVSALGQLLVVPLLAYAITQIARLEAGFAVGLILVSAMPGGAMSKVFTIIGRGNVALSITLSVVTTLSAIVTVPLLLRLLAASLIPESFEMPTAEMVQELVLYLLLPLLAGMVVSGLRPTWSRPLARTSFIIGFPLVILMVVLSLASGRIRPGEHGWPVPLTIIVFCFLAQQVNMLPFRLFPWPRQDRLAAGIEVTMRNMNLALLLNAILFPADNAELKPLGSAVLFVILFYAATAMAIGLPLALNHRRMARREMPSPLSQLKPAATAQDGL
jgi:bile acid:Na+ symporter, BASS family